MPAASDDPLPENPDERKKIIAIARKAMEQGMNVDDYTDQELETVLKKSWLEWEPKIKHVLAKTGQLEF
jgi:hypothetical protein